MTKPPQPQEDAGQQWPRTVAEAVARLVLELSQAEKDEIAAKPDDELIELHFGLGVRIREDFGLHGDNPALFLSCGKTNEDDASMVIIRALWGRLRH